MKQVITVYYLPMAATDRQRRAVMAVMTLGGRSSEPTPSKWQSWVITWSCLVFPELIAELKNDALAVDYQYEEFSATFVTECVDAVMAQGSARTAGDKFVSCPTGLPTTTLIPFIVDIVAAASGEGLYAYYAMIIFIMGKSLSPQNVQSISSKRPAAIIKKRSLNAAEFILTGDGKISPDNYRKIQSGWVRSTRPRIHVVKHLATLVASPNRSETLDPIVVNMDMLRNAGQSYIFYVHELLVACDWCIEIPALKSSFYHYARMVKILAAQQDWIRPYFKLMMQDSTKDVRRRDIEALIAVATFYAAQTRKSMKQYRISEDARPVIIAFKELAAKKGIIFHDIANQATTEVTAV